MKILKKDALEAARLFKQRNSELYMLYIYFDKKENKIDFCYSLKNQGWPSIIYNKEVEYRSYSNNYLEESIENYTIKNLQELFYDEMESLAEEIEQD